MDRTRIAVVGASGKTGRSVSAALTRVGVDVVPIGREQFDQGLEQSLIGCRATYLIAPNLHPDEADFIGLVLTSARHAGIPRVVYHSVASPYIPAMPHHLAKAVAEDEVRRSGLEWTILQPGAYLQNIDLSGPVRVPYRLDAPFGFADLHDVGTVAADVLLRDEHVGATYELASICSSVGDVAAAAGVPAEQVPFSPNPELTQRANAWLAAMFNYYDRFGLPVGTRVMRMLLQVSRSGDGRDATDPDAATSLPA